MRFPAPGDTGGGVLIDSGIIRHEVRAGGAYVSTSYLNLICNETVGRSHCVAHSLTPEKGSKIAVGGPFRTTRSLLRVTQVLLRYHNIIIVP